MLHVLPDDVQRGAQTHARALRDLLDGDGARHRTLTIFASEPGPLEADVQLGVRGGVLRRLGAHPAVVRSLRRALREERPSVVVAHGGEPLRYVRLAGGGRHATVYHRIGTSGRLLRRRRSRLAQWWALRGVDAVVAVSNDAAAELRHTGAPEPVHVIPNGRDPERYATADRSDRAAPTVLFVGHLTETKRPLVFVDAVRSVRAGGATLCAVVAGDGPLLDQVRDAAVGVADVVGRRSDVPELLRAADVFVLTSEPTGEGLPGVLIEAAMAGLPIVTTDVPGARDVVEHGVTGFVVAVDDDAALRLHLDHLVRDPSLRARMGAAGRARALDGYTIEQCAAAWSSLLRTLLGIDGSTLAA